MRKRYAVLGLVAVSAALFVAKDVSAGDGVTPAQIADLVDELRDPDTHVRDLARKELIALGEKAVPSLVALVKNGAPRESGEAVAVLAALGPVAKSAVPALSERMSAETGSARLPFLRALAEIDPSGSSATAIPVLLAFLDDKDPRVRLDAATALRSFGPTAAKFAPDVLERIPTADPSVRAALLEAVRAMGVDAAAFVVDLYTKSGEGAKTWLPSVVSELGDAIVAPAVARLASEDKGVRASAAQILGAAGPAAKGATPQLVAALKDEAGIVRRRAAEALGAIGADARVALPALADLLEDKSSRAQVEAAAAMGRVAVSSARPGDDVTPNVGTVGRAVEDGLDWLARHQVGTVWGPAGFRQACPKDSVCGGAGEDANVLGVTALATLAFLGAGESPIAGPHRANVESALQYVRGTQDADGCFGPRSMKHWVYFHAISTVAVTDAYRATQSHALKLSAMRSLEFVQRAQNPYLAWRYSFPPDGDNDTSVTGWMVRALASGKRAGLDVDAGATRNALAWVEKMTEPEFGRTGYQQRGGPPARTNEMMERFPAARSESMTAEAICIRLDAGQDLRKDDMLKRSVSLVLQKLPRWDADGSIDLYYWFHGTDAMRRIGGSPWETWRNALVSSLVPHQERSSAGCARGSWAPEDPWGQIGGRCYSTAMAVLSLEMCGLPERKAGTTGEVRAAIAALTRALESDDDALKSAARAALDDIRAAYR